MSKKQLDLFKKQTPRRATASKKGPGRPLKHDPHSLAFGGSLLKKGNPRGQRPLCSKRPIHVTMRAEWARGGRSFLKPRVARSFEHLIAYCARRSGVRVYRYQNVGNHIHMVVRLRRRSSWLAFSRSFTSLLKARLELLWGIRIKKLFDHRPFTRVGTWGREFRTLSEYTLKNLLDRWGIERTSWNLELFKVALTMNVRANDSPILGVNAGIGRQLAF